MKWLMCCKCNHVVSIGGTELISWPTRIWTRRQIAPGIGHVYKARSLLIKQTSVETASGEKFMRISKDGLVTRKRRYSGKQGIVVTKTHNAVRFHIPLIDARSNRGRTKLCDRR
jgi:hypothetical protein